MPILRQRLQFFGDSIARDDYGGEARTSSSIATVWGQIDSSPKPERVEAGQVIAATSHTVTVRYRLGLNASQRITDITSGRTFQIMSMHIEPVNTKRWLIFDCLEISPAT